MCSERMESLTVDEVSSCRRWNYSPQPIKKKSLFVVFNFSCIYQLNHGKIKPSGGSLCRCKDQMDVLIQAQVHQRREQSLQQRSVRADEQVKMKIAT
ncbi:hypothetical protein F2Q70_00043383 [Brassica cretica]|uniref:Uncharacterized protein n=1 Tax=Brassica cretica TaxID=69181 RepID=A0A8S9KPI4_BRACR|nr:hypothetical protein F2Q70_00043383 [Brassica cretica]